jgi:hypothetical protein
MRKNLRKKFCKLAMKNLRAYRLVLKSNFAAQFTILSVSKIMGKFLKLRFKKHSWRNEEWRNLVLGQFPHETGLM